MNAYEAVSLSRWFRLDEFPDPDQLKDVDGRVIQHLDTLREELGRPIHPSKHPDGWARYAGSKNSRHYAVGRLGTAGDVFPEGNVMDCWALALQGVWGGIGLYLDTRRTDFQPGPMLHLDLRDEKLLWVRDEGVYIYQKTDPDRFWKLIQKAIDA